MSAFHHPKRKPLTPRQRAKLFEEHEGKCHACGRKIRPGDIWIHEHVIALENGGTDEWSNFALTCQWCLPQKNLEDHAKGAAIRRKATKHIIPSNQKQTKRQWPKRKFDKWRKMNGDIVIVRDE